MCSCENGKYTGSIINNSLIICDEIIGTTKIVPANFNEIKVACKAKKFYISLVFLLITVALLIPVSISCYVKYQVKQKHLLSYHDTRKSKQIDIKNIL